MRLLQGGGLTKLFEEAGSLADYVIVDTTSLGVVGDALAFAFDAGELLLVGRAHNSDRRAVCTMVELLERAGTPSTGWVIIGDDTARQRHVEDAPATPRKPRAARESAPAAEPMAAPAPAKPGARHAPAAAAKGAAPKAVTSEPGATPPSAPQAGQTRCCSGT